MHKSQDYLKKRVDHNEDKQGQEEDQQDAGLEDAQQDVDKQGNVEDSRILFNCD